MLLVQNEAGYRNLLRLVSQSYLAGDTPSEPSISGREVAQAGFDEGGFTGRYHSRELSSVHIVQPSNVKLGRDRAPASTSAPPPPMRLTTRARRFLREHGRKLWWLHSAYALALGTGVVAFAHKGFDHARWLAVSLGLAWLLVVLVFRLFAPAGRAASARSRPRTRRRGCAFT